MTIKSFNSFNEKKSEKWIQDTKMKKDALHKQLGYDEDEKIPAGILKKISDAKVGSKIEVKGEEKTITSLLKKRANLAKTLKGLKEHQETQNYMFFGNLQTIKRLVDKMLEMDESELDNILKEHNWALDHIATSKDDIEEVFNFLAGHNEPHDDEEYDYRVKEETPESDHQSWMDNEPSHEETEGQLANKDLEDEMKNIKSFGNFAK
jgi:Holliday junction resolvase RusA-like endonuclease